MVEQKHTRGPWKVTINPNWSPDSEWAVSREIVIRPEISPSDSGWVADCGLSVDAEHMANASLIAAAPQMLEALKNLENDDGSIPEHAWEIVQRAIKQAEQSYT